MRQFILIAAMLLTSASAQAEGPRGLSTAASEPAVAAQPKPAETPNAGTPRVAEQSSATDAVPQQPQADQAGPDPANPSQANPSQAKSAYTRPDKPKARREPLEVRVIGELHRHGIYW